MQITPLEVQNHQFGASFRGFDRDEVREFMSMLSREYEQVISENILLRDQNTELRQRLTESQEREMRIQKAIETAERVTREMKETARRESGLLVKEARLKAEKLLEQAATRRSNMENQVNDLKLLKDRFEHRLRAMLEEHLQTLDHAGQIQADDKIFLLPRPTSA